MPGSLLLVNCAQVGLNTSEIYGYNHEELTHAAVITQIVAGSADVGMGILSAARLCGLGFIPLCLGQYDLLIPDYAWPMDAMQKLIAILKSTAFRERLTVLGGYELDKPGEIRHYFQ